MSVIIENIFDLDLRDTLDCGQAFRWVEINKNEFKGTVCGKTVVVSMDNNNLTINGSTNEDVANIWHDYFDLSLDYAKIRENLSTIHPTLKNAATYCPNIRILKQDPFEALCSFIISQNNNIPRIKGIIKSFCENFGEYNGEDYAFPTPETIASKTEKDLQIIKSGFRAKYLIDASQKVASGEIDFDVLDKLQLPQIQENLMKIKGVGPKVSDCVMLYGMHKLSCFPLDVWMKRAMEKLFPELTPSDFGQYAGIAQQYIFHYSRMNPQIFD